MTLSKQQALDAARNLEPDCPYGAVGAGKYRASNEQRRGQWHTPSMNNDERHVVDPISPGEATSPEELEKRERFGEELAHAMADVTCDQHGLGTKTWHVGVEMRSPIEVRDRFFVTLDADEKRIRDIGPMSADVANHLLFFIESGLEAGLPGSEGGSLSREVIDRSQPVG